MLTTNTSAVLEKAVKLTNWMADNVPEREIPDSYKSRAAGTCFTIVRNHQAAIVHLIDEKHHSPAFSLARGVYEGYIRGAWLLHCGSELQADKFLDGEELQDSNGKKLSITDLINALEQTPAFDKGSLLQIKRTAWTALCDFAHVGGRLVSHWNTSKAIEANFSPKETDEVLILTGVFAVLACVGMVDLAQTPAEAELMEMFMEQLKAFGAP